MKEGTQEPNVLPVEEVVKQAMILAAIPAVAMLLGGLYPVMTATLPSKRITYAMQHLAAGILLCAIAQELVPTLSAANKADELWGIFIGFTLGVVVMVGLGAIVGDHEEEESDGLEESMLENAQNPVTPTQSRLRDGVEMDDPGGEASQTPSTIMKKTQKTSFVRASSSIAERSRQNSLVLVPAFPITFAVAVYIDSALDGLLIGLTLVTGQSAGMFMAIALCVEMGFLGLTFSVSCAPQPVNRKVPAAVLGPVVLMIGSMVGGLVATFLATNYAYLVACTSFGTAALLYMVCEELLVAAHETGEEHVWWVDLQVYLGFMASLGLQKCFDVSDK